MKKTLQGDLVNTFNSLKKSLPKLFIPKDAIDYLSKFDKGYIDGITCWRDNSVERRLGSLIHDVGLFAKKSIKTGKLVAIKSGRVVDEKVIKEKENIIDGSHQQIGLDKFLAGLTLEEVDLNLVGYNHSCNPNAKLVLLEGVGLAFLVTKREIKKGNEVTVNYSVSYVSDTQKLDPCKCKSPNCRRIIQPSTDWNDEKFQKANAGDFPWYIQEMINAGK